MHVLLTGTSGQLGAYLLQHLRGRGIPTVAWSGATAGELFGTPLRPVELADRDAVATAFREARPGIVLHAAAMARLSDCHREPERARRVNAEASALLAELADGAGARLVFVSTDLVFDGQRGGYREDDPPAPLSVYGRTKAEAEKAVLADPRNVVARVSLGADPAGIVAARREQTPAKEPRPRDVSLDSSRWRSLFPDHPGPRKLRVTECLLGNRPADEIIHDGRGQWSAFFSDVPPATYPLLVTAEDGLTERVLIQVEAGQGEAGHAGQAAPHHAPAT